MRHRGERSRTTHLNLNILHDRCFLDGRKFIRYRPARTSGGGAKLLLQGDAVDLNHHAIDIIWQLMALLV